MCNETVHDDSAIRVSRNHRTLVAGLATIAGLVLAACAPTPTATQPPPTEMPTQVPIEVPTAVPTEVPVRMGEVYRLAILADITTLNVWALYGPDASFWNYAVTLGYYPTLFTYSDQRFDFIPWLAAAFPTELEQEGNFWVGTVTLKPGVLWSDGTEITAADVAFTANTAVAFHLGGNWTAVYDDRFLDHVEPLDPYTVKFYFHTRPGLGQWHFGALMGPIVNRAFWEPRLADAAALSGLEGLRPGSAEYATRLNEALQILYRIDPTGEPTAGGYSFKSWEPGLFVENEYNPYYFFREVVVTQYANGAYQEVKEGVYEFSAYGDPTGERVLEYTIGPHFEKVLYRVYSSQDAAVLALRNGEVDYVLSPDGLGAGLQAQLGDDPNVTLFSNPSNGFRYLAFNFTHPPLDDPAVRQALAVMTDRDFLTQNLLQGHAIPAYTLVPEGNRFWYNQNMTKWGLGMTTEERLNEAVRILKEAGYTWDVEPAWNPDGGGSVKWGQGLKLPDGTPFPEMHLLALGADYDPTQATAALFVQQQANQLGMPISANLTNFDDLAAALDTGDFDLFILEWVLSVYPDYLCALFHTGASLNVGRYSNPEFDVNCDAFLAETDLEAARQQAFALQETLAQELPYIVLFTTPIIEAYRNDTIAFPYTEVLDGISLERYGLQTLVRPTVR